MGSDQFGTSSRFLTTNSFFTNAVHFPSPRSSPYNYSSSCFFSTRNSEFDGPYFDGDDSFTTQPELSDLGFENVRSEIAESMVSISGGGGEESILPVRALISLLDGFHDLTGLPWWIVIPFSTLALRVALLPLLILQLKKVKRIGELFPKLPPPFPPPLSGRSYKEQFTLFFKEKRAVGCPSFLWHIAYISIQIPCFLLGVTSIRKMSLDHHSGFDCEGILWFQDLTAIPHGVLGFIFPLLIAGLHLTNVQVSFRNFSMIKTSDLFRLVARLYQFYLQFLTVPILVIGLYVPQGSLVYWVTNSSLTLIQQLALSHPHVCEKLGLPDKSVAPKDVDDREVPTPGMMMLDSWEKNHEIIANDLSPLKLVNLSIQLLASKQQDRAITVLRLALDKDPEYVRALVILGQTLLQKELLVEATECLESAITKLSLLGQPTEVEDIDLLIVASQLASRAYAQQGKMAEGIVHLERIGRLEEPLDIRSKAHYYEGLMFLAIALSIEGRKAEAEKYMRILVAYNPAYNEYFRVLENGEGNFVDELVNSRRRDY